MGVEETFHGTVGILLVVGVGVMLDMRSSPIQSGSLKGHGAANQEEAPDPVWSLETLVGQHPMIADRNSQSAENIADDKKCQIGGSDETAPEAENGIGRADQGNPDKKLEDNLGGQGNWLGRHNI